MRVMLRGTRTVLVLLFAIAPLQLSAQTSASLARDSSAREYVTPAHYWRNMTAGFLTSLLVHESGHIGTSLALGRRPTFGFDKLRPTVYSGIDGSREPHNQFLFSSMGLNAQSALDELILDTPHSRGSSFERGVLAGGIATTLFYLTAGRNGAVSDVELMARFSSLNKTDITLIYGSIAALHVFRIHRDGHYANLFARPGMDANRGLRIGVNISGEP